jgi:Glycosyltransferase family 87
VPRLPRVWLIAAFVGCALFAGGLALFTTDPLHRFWGIAAASAYVVAALALMVWKSRGGVDVALTVIVCGAVLVPLVWMAWHGQSQPEVTVVARSAKTLIKNGTPYKDPKQLASTTDPNAYNPYLPLMSAFGVPQAVIGHSVLTDPRVWFGIVFLVVFAAALKVGGAKDSVRWSLLVTASPIIALELAVGGTDVPIVAFICLGFAFLWRRGGEISAGVALGVASSMKSTAWLALAVAFALLIFRDGKREAWRFTAMALAVVAVCVGPFAVTRPGSLVNNTILFPLGLASVKSAAASPLIGHLIAQTGHLGHAFVVFLLIASGVAIAVSLVVRPPRTVPSATIRLVIGLSVLFILAPSTRFGYFIYPAALVLWLIVTMAGRRAETGSSPAPPAPAVVAQGLTAIPARPPSRGRRSLLARRHTTERTTDRLPPAAGCT